jgi:hypothetical protein
MRWNSEDMKFEDDSRLEKLMDEVKVLLRGAGIGLMILGAITAITYFLKWL